MKVSKEITVKQEVLEQVICNKCSQVFHVVGKNMNYEGLHANASFGFESKYFGDMEEIEFDLCEKCLFDFVKTFEIEPDYRNYEYEE